MAVADLDLVIARALTTPGPDGRFGHRQHVELGWAVIERYGVDGGEDFLCTLLQVSITGGGHGLKYHETMSRFWARMIADAVRRDGETFADFFDANPALADSGLWSRYYSTELLFSDAARTTWHEPDLAPLSAWT